MKLSSKRIGKSAIVEVDLESESEGDVEVLGLRKLDDVLHNIIVRQSAPDWLPFVPSSSYWVSSRCHRPESHGLVEVLNQLTNPLTEDESIYILESPSFEQFFKYVELTNFDVASDAFSSHISKNHERLLELLNNLAPGKGGCHSSTYFIEDNSPVQPVDVKFNNNQDSPRIVNVSLKSTQLENVQDESATKILSDVDGPTEEVVDVVVIEF
ncbi:hypothetical protein L1887_05053 [Cichorium endivia]|nr:hypothetical protein L1887_05053 [Cichorium endivia]